MQMLYNSDSYIVVQFEVTPSDETAFPDAHADAHADAQADVHIKGRGGFEIVDKFARKEIFIEGALAERFQRGVQEIVAQHPAGASPETLDDYIAGFTELAQNPVVLH